MKKDRFTNADELSHHDERIQFMNNQDVQIQVLSYGNGSPSNLVGQKAIELCQSQRSIGKLYCKYPNRFVGFATLPINEPEAAAREFERCINDLGFKGALIMGRAQDGFLIKTNMTLFSKAENLDVPIYLHPRQLTVTFINHTIKEIILK